MNSTAILDISPITLDTKTQGKSKTPYDVGNSLFQALLAENSESSVKDIFGTSLYSEGGFAKFGLSGKGAGPNSNDLRILIPFAQMMLPESAIPQLISFLKCQGLSIEKIDQMITSARNKDGLLSLDKILAQLAGGEGKATDKSSPVVPSSNIPMTQELLFKMGLGAGEVKEAFEKSVNQKGDLDIDKLKAALEKTFPRLSSGSTLNTLLENSNIKVKPDIMEGKTTDPKLKKEFLNFLQTPSQDLQKKIKQDIAALLRDKGIPPQEVKSFLETLNVDFTRSRLNDKSSKKGDGNLVNNIVIKEKPHWQKGEWNEKILEILRDERLLVSNDINGKNSHEQGDIKLNLAELLKKGDPRIETGLLSGESAKKTGAINVKADSRVEKGSPTTLPKNELGSDFTLQKTDKEIKIASPVNQARDVYNLPQPLPKILDRMIWMIRAGEQSSRIMIHPPELGRLDLDLAIKNGHLQAHLSAESTVVKEIIEANLNQLKQQLNDQGLIVDRFEVMVSLDDRRFKEGDMWARNERRGSSSKRRTGTNIGEPVIEESPLEQSTDNHYQIDVHV